MQATCSVAMTSIFSCSRQCPNPSRIQPPSQLSYKLLPSSRLWAAARQILTHFPLTAFLFAFLSCATFSRHFLSSITPPHSLPLTMGHHTALSFILFCYFPCVSIWDPLLSRHAPRSTSACLAIPLYTWFPVPSNCSLCISICMYAYESI